MMHFCAGWVLLDDGTGRWRGAFSSETYRAGAQSCHHCLSNETLGAGARKCGLPLDCRHPELVGEISLTDLRPRILRDSSSRRLHLRKSLVAWMLIRLTPNSPPVISQSKVGISDCAVKSSLSGALDIGDWSNWS